MNALDALYRCRRAWEATQPQLFWTDENLWGDGWTGSVREAALPVEPVAPPFSPRDGLETAFDGDGANPIKVARRPQKGA